MNSQEEARFRKDLLDAVAEARKLGYPPNEFVKMIERDGPFVTIKKIIPKKEPSDGFVRLLHLKRIDLTCEAIVVETPWRSFFDDDLIEIAEKRLSSVGYPYQPYAEVEKNGAANSNVGQKANNGDFDPPQFDGRERQLRETTIRPEQSNFRQSLLTNYEARCCITGCAVREVLEAAHICAYRGPESNHIRNGLLLRGDLHSLFDRYLLSINPRELLVELSGRLESDPFYSTLSGTALIIPNAATKPSQRALEIHWETFKTG